MIIGVFTTIKVKHGIPLFFEEHKKRLESHAKALHFPLFSLTITDVENFLKNNNVTDAALKVTATPQKKHSILTMDTRSLPSEEPIKLITIEDKRGKNKMYKTTDRLENEKAKKIAKKFNAHDALFVKNNKLIESTIANIFSLNKDGNIITPPLKGKGLEGITRKIIMKNLNVIEEEISEKTNQPIILVNSLRIQKATHLNGGKLQDGEKLFQKIKSLMKTAEKNYLFISKRGVARSEGFPITRSEISIERARREGDRARTPSEKKTFYKGLKTWIDPEELFQKLFAKSKNAFWLDSSLTNKSSRFSYMGIPQKIVYYSLTKNTITIKNETITKKYKQNIFDYLDERLAKNTLQDSSLPFPFIGGYVGYFGYELKKLTGAKFAYFSSYPDSLWFLINQFIVFDHKEKKVYLVCVTNNKIEANKWFNVMTNEVKQSTNKIASSSFDKLRTPHNDKKIEFKLNRDHKKYLNDIQTCKDYLAKGESYQICLTNEFTTTANIDPLSLYLTLRKTNPAPFAAFIKNDDLAILCCSPEEFLRIEDRFVQTKPIKGTIRRGNSKQEDKKLMRELSQSKKDWSENAMIVDLLRNDLGKVCEFGSVQTPKLMQIESYQTVHQLVSTVTGKLRNDVSLIDCVRAAFPGGSMTGAPKTRTMEIIDSLEKKARGIYSGSLGFLSFNKNALLNIVIRTIIMKKNLLSIGAGGAILFDSNPEKEYEEMYLKANVLMKTVSSLYNPPMHTVFLALGSNLGNKKNNIEKAIQLLGKKITTITVAKIYETKPMYYENQDTFLNSVLRGETTLSPEELLSFVKTLEKEIGRKKTFRNGPREIDIDILFYDDLILQTESLQIPHPRIAEREFVLKPLMDIDPKLIHPVLKKPISSL